MPAPVVGTVLAVGDIAGCTVDSDEATADLVAGLVAERPDAQLALVGDLVYERGLAAEWAQCYEPGWGRFRDRSRPAAGNHEYGTSRADGYFAYWGRRAGPKGQGWYSYDVGPWHMIALNSNCEIVGCGPESAQGRWLAADLAAHASARCSIAYWHHPRWSSAIHGSQAKVDPLWRAVTGGGVDVVLAGHDHNYERFGPIDGVRSFVVGTGGRSHYPVGSPIAHSEANNSNTFGVLVLTLHDGSFDWRFAPTPGTGTFTDSGTAACR